MATRSPNYPAIDLRGALVLVEKAFKSENRNKMSQVVLAKHLGYNSINGRSLGRIGAVRAYGLIEGRGDELRVSDDAVTALMAPGGSPDRHDALERLALRPALFKQLRDDFPATLPSEDNLKYSLVKRGYTSEAAGKAAKTYLATMRLVSENPGSYDASDEPEDEEMMMPETGSEQSRQQRQSGSGASGHSAAGGKDEFSVLLQGNRLKINATVDAEGIARLKQVLEKYEEILKLLQ